MQKMAFRNAKGHLLQKRRQLFYLEPSFQTYVFGRTSHHYSEAARLYNEAVVAVPQPQVLRRKHEADFLFLARLQVDALEASQRLYIGGDAADLVAQVELYHLVAGYAARVLHPAAKPYAALHAYDGIVYPQVV